MRSKIQTKVAYNTLVQTAGRLVTAMAVFLSTIILARNLGSSLFGKYIQIMSYLAIFLVVIDWGMNQIFLRKAHQKIGRLWPKFFTLRIYLGLMAMALSITGVLILGWWNRSFSSPIILGVIVGSISILSYGVFLSCLVVFQAKSKYDQAVSAQVLGSVITLVTLMFFFRLSANVSSAGVTLGVLAYVLGSIATAITCLFFLRKHLKRNYFNINFQFWQELIKTSLPLGGALLLNGIYMKAGVLMLPLFRGSSEVGSYGLAVKFFEFVLTVPTFLINSLYPFWLKAAHKTNWPKTLQKHMLVTLVLGIILGVGFWLIAPWLIFIKTDFYQSTLLLRELAFLIPLFFMTSPLMWLFIINHKQQDLLWLYGTACILSLIINWWLMPHIGARGAIFGLAVAELTVLVNGWIKIKTYEYKP